MPLLSHIISHTICCIFLDRIVLIDAFVQWLLVLQECTMPSRCSIAGFVLSIRISLACTHSSYLPLYFHRKKYLLWSVLEHDLCQHILFFDLCLCLHRKNCDLFIHRKKLSLVLEYNKKNYLSFHWKKVVSCVLWLCLNRMKFVVCPCIEKSCLLCFVIVLE